MRETVSRSCIIAERSWLVDRLTDSVGFSSRFENIVVAGYIGSDIQQATTDLLQSHIYMLQFTDPHLEQIDS